MKQLSVHFYRIVRYFSLHWSILRLLQLVLSIALIAEGLFGEFTAALFVGLWLAYSCWRNAPCTMNQC